VVQAREDAPGARRLVVYLLVDPGASPSVGDLRAFLGQHLPGYMMPSAFVMLTPAFSAIEAMAERYVEAMRAVQPAGPYLLGGWSMGRTVALEMAQQLKRRGQEVALLVLLDVMPPDAALNLAALAQELGQCIGNGRPGAEGVGS